MGKQVGYRSFMATVGDVGLTHGHAGKRKTGRTSVARFPALVTSFETQTIDPKLPIKHHLPKHGTPAFQMWKEGTNVRGSMKFFGHCLINFGGMAKCFRALKLFTRTQIISRRK